MKTLAGHISRLNDDRGLLGRMRAASLGTINEITWSAAGRRLLTVYTELVAQRRASASKAGSLAEWAGQGAGMTAGPV